MNQSRLNGLLVVLVSVALVLVGITAVSCVYNGDTTLLQAMTLSEDTITPNADGDTDATLLQYELVRNALVSIYLDGEDGTRYWFRRDKTRSPQSYRVAFSGVVEGYVGPGEQFDGDVLARLVPDGVYQLTVEATEVTGGGIDGNNDDTPLVRGETMRVSQPLTIVGADAALPSIRNLNIVPRPFGDDWVEGAAVPFEPNRDGIRDRLNINFYLDKDVEQLRVYLLTEDGVEYDAVEAPLDVPVNQMGAHTFEYTGGIDEGATPPPDGRYDMFVYAADAEGQKFRTQGEIDLKLGGIPRVEIAAPASSELDTFRLSDTTIELCETLTFSVTVRNYGDTPIRTTGPAPGTVYDSDWNYNTLGWFTESGAFRIGVGYETELKDYAYRWAVGSVDELTERDGHYYLEPGQQVVVHGGIRIVEPLGSRNPQPFWVGLIHEDVEISQFNNRQDPHAVEIDLPPDGMTIMCDEREIVTRPTE